VCGYNNGKILYFGVPHKSACRELQTNGCRVTGVKWLPDGRKILSCDDMGKTVLWNSRSGCIIAVLSTGLAHVKGFCCSPDGSTIMAFYDVMFSAWFWDVEKKIDINVLNSSDCFVHCADWSPDSSELATADMENNICIYDVRSRNKVLAIKGHKCKIHIVLWSPNGAFIASNDAMGEVRVWDKTTGRPTFYATCPMNSVYRHVRWSASSDRLLGNTLTELYIIPVCSWSDRVNRVFGPDAKKIIFTLMCVKHRHEKRGCITRTTLMLLPKTPIAIWLYIFQILMLCKTRAILA
jgi:WD40 repeat protein